MKETLFNSGRLSARLFLAALIALSIFALYSWLMYEENGNSHTDQTPHTLGAQVSSDGHRRLSAAQIALLPLSTQYQLIRVVTMANGEDSIATIRDLQSGRRDQQVHLGGELVDGSIVREIFPNEVVLDRDGRLERVGTKKIAEPELQPKSTDAKRTHDAADEETESTPQLVAISRASEELPRMGLSISSVHAQPRRIQKPREPQARNSARDQQIAESAKLQGFHLEQRNRMIVPHAPDTTVLETPERSVPKAQGNRLPTASYTPPQS